MTSARRGEGGFKNCPILRTNSTDRLREMRMKGGGGVKKSQNVADVLKVSPLRGIPALVVLDKNGDIVTKDGRADVQAKGPGVVNQWKKGKV